MQKRLDYLAPILEAVQMSGRSERQVSLTATGQPTAIAMLKTGRVPSVKRVQALCEILGLEFYIGPPRDEGLGNALKRTEEVLDRLRSKVKATATDLTDDTALAGPKISAEIFEFPASLVPDVLPVPLREEVRAAAGSGAVINNEAVMGYLPFRRDWLANHGINNKLSSVIAVLGDSMEPNLQNGAWILVDHQRVRRLQNRIFVMGTEGGTIVKRLAKEDGGWQLTSDNRNYKLLPWPREATVVGQVMWTGRTL